MIIFKDVILRHHAKILLKNISGHFLKGQLIGLTGLNGTGKTSFLKSLAGLHSDYTGHLSFHQKNLREYSLKEMAQMRTYIPAILVCHWSLSTKQIMSIHLGKADFNHDLLNVLSLHSLLDQNFLTLSCGEKARVFLACALMRDTSLLLLDEITSHLDDHYQTLALQLLQDHAHQGKTIICSMHQKNLALAYCDQVLCLENQTFSYLKETVLS